MVKKCEVYEKRNGIKIYNIKILERSLKEMKCD